MIIILTKEIHVIGKSRDLLVSVKLVPLWYEVYKAKIKSEHQGKCVENEIWPLKFNIKFWFAKSPERPNGLCSGWYQFHRYNMLSKSTVVALCSLLVWFNFISALDILMKALLVCCIDLVFKLVPLQWYSYFKFAFSMYSYIGSNYMWPHEESREN